MQTHRQVAANPQTKINKSRCEFICRRLPSTRTIAIYRYYSAKGRWMQFSHLPESTLAVASAWAGCIRDAAASSPGSESNSSMWAYVDSSDSGSNDLDSDDADSSGGDSNDGRGGLWGSGGGRDSRTVCCMPSSCPGNSFTSSGTTPYVHITHNCIMVAFQVYLIVSQTSLR